MLGHFSRKVDFGWIGIAIDFVLFRVIRYIQTVAPYFEASPPLVRYVAMRRKATDRAV